MTREERKTALHVIKKFSSVWEFDEEEEKAIDNIIDELEQEPTDKNFTKADIDAIIKAINAHWELIIDEIRADIQKLRNCSCSCSDGIIDDVEDILDKYKADKEQNDEKESLDRNS